jgi:anti-anti-sigma factor
MHTPGGHHWLDREDVDGLTVVRVRLAQLRGEDTAQEVFALLYALVDEAGRNRIVLNLGRVETLDSAALGKLVLLNHKLQAAGGRLALCGLGPAADQALQAMHVVGTFTVCASEEEAVRSFPPAPLAPPAVDEGSTGGC